MSRQLKNLCKLAILLGHIQMSAAGDETDYSAPYVTVENGELVTRYPAKKHDPDSPDSEAGVSREDVYLPWWASAAAVTLILAALLWIRRGCGRA